MIIKYHKNQPRTSPNSNLAPVLNLRQNRPITKDQIRQKLNNFIESFEIEAGNFNSFFLNRLLPKNNEICLFLYFGTPTLKTKKSPILVLTAL